MTVAVVTTTGNVSTYAEIYGTLSGNITRNLPAVAGYAGKIFMFKKIGADGYTITLEGDGTETIDGALTRVIQYQYEYVQLLGVDASPDYWVIVSDNKIDSERLASLDYLNQE
jgi:hypothetical protein